MKKLFTLILCFMVCSWSTTQAQALFGLSQPNPGAAGTNLVFTVTGAIGFANAASYQGGITIADPTVAQIIGIAPVSGDPNAWSNIDNPGAARFGAFPNGFCTTPVPMGAGNALFNVTVQLSPNAAGLCTTITIGDTPIAMEVLQVGFGCNPVPIVIGSTSNIGVLANCNLDPHEPNNSCQAAAAGLGTIGAGQSASVVGCVAIGDEDFYSFQANGQNYITRVGLWALAPGDYTLTVALAANGTDLTLTTSAVGTDCNTVDTELELYDVQCNSLAYNDDDPNNPPYSRIGIEIENPPCAQAVENVTWTVDGTSLTVCWDDNESDFYYISIWAQGIPGVGYPAGTQTCLTIDDLEVCTEYSFTVVNSCNFVQFETQVNTFETDCCLAPVTGVTWEADVNSVTICWDDNSSTEYLVSFGQNGNLGFPVSNGTETCITFDNLEACTDYVFGITNHCQLDNGLLGIFESPIFIFNTICCDEPVTGVTFDVVHNSVTICWDDNESVNYNVAWGLAGGPFQLAQAGTNNCVTIDNLDPCEDYEFFVRNFCELPGDITAIHSTQIFSFSTECCNEAVEDVSFDVNGTSVTICWTDNGSSEYSVQYMAAGGAPMLAIAGTQTCIAIDDLDPCQDYEFFVRNLCANSTGATLHFTQIFTFETPCCDEPVEDVTFTATDTSVTICWTDNGSDTYSVQYNSVGGPIQLAIAGHDTCITIDDLEPCTDYEFFVRNLCVQPDGTSLHFTTTFTFSTDCCDSPVTDVSVGEISWNSATISWTNNGSSAYTVAYRPVGSPFWMTMPPITSSPYTLTGLNQCTEYEFMVINWCEGQNYVNGIFTFMTPAQNPWEACPEISFPTDGGGSGIKGTFGVIKSNSPEEELEVVKLSLYPNPVASHELLTVRIDSESFRPTVLTLFNTQGQMIDQQQLDLGDRTVSEIPYMLPHNVQSGMHIMNLSDATGTSKVLKFVIGQ